MAFHKVDFIGGRLAGAIVPKSCLGGEAWELPQAIIEFTNDVQAVAQYADFELEAAVLGIYLADYYLAQVNNGGHSQFVGNSGHRLAANIDHALLGLKTIGAQEQYSTLADLKTWVASNLEEAAVQDGFGTRANELDVLDTRFYDAEKRASISDLAARWLATWPKLETVDDKHYQERLKALRAVNPSFDIRRIARAIEQNRFILTDTLQMTVAVLCGAVAPEPDVMIRITAGSHIEFEGQAVIRWGVMTSNGVREAIVLNDGGILRESLDSRNQIARVSALMVHYFVDAAERNNAAAAIDLVMVRAGYMTSDVGDPALTAWRLEGDRATFIARIFIAHDNVCDLVIRTGPGGAELLDASGSPKLVVSMDEIAAHQEQARRGLASMQLGD